MSNFCAELGNHDCQTNDLMSLSNSLQSIFVVAARLSLITFWFDREQTKAAQALKDRNPPPHIWIGRRVSMWWPLDEAVSHHHRLPTRVPILV